VPIFGTVPALIALYMPGSADTRTRVCLILLGFLVRARLAKESPDGSFILALYLTSESFPKAFEWFSMARTPLDNEKTFPQHNPVTSS
jgi:hypothetical protein